MVPLVEDTQDVVRVYEPYDLIERSLISRQPGPSRLDKRVMSFSDGGVCLDRDDIRSRDHDLVDASRAKIEDGADHPTFRCFDLSVRSALLHEEPELF